MFSRSKKRLESFGVQQFIMDSSYGLVDPMEVFAAMTASLLEKQPVPFNPIYAIKPTPVQKLKIGGKPPREVFYRDTLTYMTKLPPPVQPKICTCQYLCNGAPAAIICHSCSIYDPSRSAFYCERCFPVRHPWHRVPHLFTTIENDESIEHTFKIAHRVAEAKRYEDEGKGILNRLRQEIPKLNYVADDKKIDNDVRAYGRRMVAVQEKLQELQAALRQDILHGDEHRRANLYSREDSATVEPETLQIENGSRSTHSRRTSSTSTVTTISKANSNNPINNTTSTITSTTTNTNTPGPLKLAELRNLPFFESEPLFTDLIEGESSPVLPVETKGHTPEVEVLKSIVPMYVPGADNSGSDDGNEANDNNTNTDTINDANADTISPITVHTPGRPRVSFIRQDSTDSTGSMTISPMNDPSHTTYAHHNTTHPSNTHNTAHTTHAHSHSFFRDNTIPELDTIDVVAIDNNISASADENDNNNANVDNMEKYVDNYIDNYVEDEHLPHSLLDHVQQEYDTANNSAVDVTSTDVDQQLTVNADANNANASSANIIGLGDLVNTNIDNNATTNIDTSSTTNELNTLPINERASSPGLKKVLSGISFTSVAHTDIDSVHSNANSNNSIGSNEYYNYNADTSNANLHANNNISNTSNTERYMNRSMYNSDLSTLSSSSVNIQRMFKGYIGRRTVSKMLTTRLVRVFSPEVGRDYYYDKISGASMWEPPKQLQADHLDELQYVSEAAPTKIWACKRDCPRRKKDKITRKVLAKIVITAFARCILARNRVKRRADAVYRRVWDADSSTYYYADVITGETSWVKNKVYINPSSEPPVYSDSGIADSVVNMNSLNVGSNKYGSSKKGSVKGSKRISPRMNRVF